MAERVRLPRLPQKIINCLNLKKEKRRKPGCGSNDLKNERIKRIEEKKKFIGSQKERKLQKYSEGFNRIFTFFLQSSRFGILNFGGSKTEVEFDINGDEGKYCFRKLENGQYQNGEIPKTRHPNILRCVMIGKKSWGLHVDMWSDGIVECSFTLEEILEEFSSKNITIPDSFLLDFKNRIKKKREIKFQKESNKILEERKINIQKEIEKLQSGGMWV